MGSFASSLHLQFIAEPLAHVLSVFLAMFHGDKPNPQLKKTSTKTKYLMFGYGCFQKLGYPKMDGL